MYIAWTRSWFTPYTFVNQLLVAISSLRSQSCFLVLLHIAFLLCLIAFLLAAELDHFSMNALGLDLKLLIYIYIYRNMFDHFPHDGICPCESLLPAALLDLCFMSLVSPSQGGLFR